MSELKTTVNSSTEEKKNPVEVLEHPDFEGNMKTNITSSIELADVVSSLFAPAFHDYLGCKILVNDGRGWPAVNNSMPAGTLYVDLFFKDQGKVPEGSSEIKNILKRGTTEVDTSTEEKRKSNLGARFAAVNGSNNGRAFTVTKRTYEALEPFMLQGNRTNWNAHTQEISASMSIYGKDEIVTCISGINLNKVITEIYGDVTKDARYEYTTSVSTVIPGKSQEFIIQICQLDLALVRDLQKTLGVYNGQPYQFHQYR